MIKILSLDTLRALMVHYASSGELEKVKNCIESLSYPVDCVAPGEITALMAASHYKKPEVLKYLLEKGADPNKKCAAGYTPLIYSLLEEGNPCAKILLDHGCDVNISDTKGGTALMRAAFHGMEEIFFTLLNKGADPKVVGEHGATAFVFCAVGKCSINIARTLKSLGVDVNKKALHGDTALHTAIKKGEKEFSLELVKLGCDIDAKNDKGDTPREMLISRNWSF